MAQMNTDGVQEAAGFDLDAADLCRLYLSPSVPSVAIPDGFMPV